MTTVESRVLDYSTQLPLEGVSVQLQDGQGNVIATTKTDPSGYYTFSNDVLNDPASALLFNLMGYGSASGNADFYTLSNPVLMVKTGTLTKGNWIFLGILAALLILIIFNYKKILAWATDKK